MNIDIKKEHLVILRSYGNILDFKNYNCQELGLAKALTKKGLKVTFLMPENDNNTESINTPYGEIFIAHIRIKWKIHARYCWFENLESRLSNLKPTLVQVHDMDLLMTWRAVKWAKKTDTPCFLIQGPYDTWQRPVFRQLNEIYNKTFGKNVIKNVTRIGVKTKLASIYLNRYKSCTTSPTLVGLDTDIFQHPTEHNWRKKLSIENKRILLYVGSFHPRRNPLFLIDIINNLPDEYVLVLVGGGVQEEDVKLKIANDCLENRCFMLGRLKQKDLPSLYSTSDCFLLASDYEIFGMVIIEAMYFGIPVISSHTTGAEFIISNTVNGYIVENKKIEDWINTIKSLFNDEEKLKTIGEAGRKNVNNRFIWDKTSDSFVNLYFGN